MKKGSVEGKSIKTYKIKQKSNIANIKISIVENSL